MYRFSEKEPGTGIENWEKLASQLAKIPHVKSAAPAFYESGYLIGAIQGAGVALKGVDVRPGAPLADALRHLKAGSVEALRQPETGSQLPGIVLGSRLAGNIGAVNGKQVIMPYGAERRVDAVRTSPELRAVSRGRDF